MNPISYGIIILAAGSSSRLGTPKQLIDFKGKNLLQHTIDIATNTTAEKVVVVLNDSIQITIESNEKVEVHINEQTAEGMSTSIKKGIELLVQQLPNIDAALIMVCDQPYCTSELLCTLVKTSLQENKHIVAASYGGTYGTPVLFYKKYFYELKQLHGDSGAKKIILQHESDLAFVNFPLGTFDIDTLNDVKLLAKRSA